MQLKNKYYKYFQEISDLLEICKNDLAIKISHLNVGDKFQTQNHTIYIKKITSSYGQMLYHMCLYDNFGKLVRSHPIFLSQPTRQKYV